MEELESRADVSADAITGELTLTHIRDTANLDTRHTYTHTPSWGAAANQKT